MKSPNKTNLKRSYSKSYQVMVRRKKGDSIVLKYPFVPFDDSNVQYFTTETWKQHLAENVKDAERVVQGVECTLEEVKTLDGTISYKFTRYYPSLEGDSGNLAFGTLTGYALQERNMTENQKVPDAIKVVGKDVDAVMENFAKIAIPDGNDDDVTGIKVTWLADPFEVTFSSRDGRPFHQNVSPLSVEAVRS